MMALSVAAPVARTPTAPPDPHAAANFARKSNLKLQASLSFIVRRLAAVGAYFIQGSDRHGTSDIRRLIFAEYAAGSQLPRICGKLLP
jgi:hypothetical protein